MKLTCTKAELLGPLSRVAAVANPKSTMPILANVLLTVDGGRLSMTCSDLESELVSSIPATGTDGAITVPARKLMDVVKAMADAPLSISLEADRLIVKCGRSRHQLVTLPASEFPATEATDYTTTVTVPAEELRGMIERTGFAMAVADVRFYLNGLMLEVRADGIRCAATDGHRMAYCGASGDVLRSIIIPRKAVLEMSRMIDSGDVEISISDRGVRVTCGANVATCRLIDGRFPNYEQMAVRPDTTAICNRQELIDGLRRASVLSNEKFRGVKLEVTNGAIAITSGNAENDASSEVVDASDCTDLAAAWKVDYLLDALGALSCERVELCVENGQRLYVTDGESVHVVMCLRL